MTAVGGEESRARKGAGRHQRVILALVVISMFINVLMLTSPIYMLQIYDRVITSGSIETLTLLTVVALLLLLMLSYLEINRSRIIARLGEEIEGRLAEQIFADRRTSTSADWIRRISDARAVRGFFQDSNVSAFLDAPWTPFYILLIFAFHPILGGVALAGAAVALLLAVVTDILTRALSGGTKGDAEAIARLEADATRNSEAIAAMGMTGALHDAWLVKREPVSTAQRRVSDVLAMTAGASRACRYWVQVAMLAVGAWLVIDGRASAGVMIASSIMLGRALAPVERATGSWRSFNQARAAWARIRAARSKGRDGADHAGPSSVGAHLRLVVENLVSGAEGGGTPPVRGVSFVAEAGQAVGVIGPSGSGKTALARLLVGLRQPAFGSARLGGADLVFLGVEDRQQSIGYLPQTTDEFVGRIDSFIARLSPEPPPAAVVAAAQTAGCDAMIRGLEHGYAAVVGDGLRLSSGQLRRLALARALYGRPSLVVLDDPGAHLDAEGEAAIAEAIRQTKEQGRIAVVMTNSPRLLAQTDHTIVLTEGRMIDAGATGDVLKRFMTPVTGRRLAAAEERA